MLYCAANADGYVKHRSHFASAGADDSVWNHVRRACGLTYWIWLFRYWKRDPYSCIKLICQFSNQLDIFFWRFLYPATETNYRFVAFEINHTFNHLPAKYLDSKVVLAKLWRIVNNRTLS